MPSPELSLVVPFYNEEDGCEKVVLQLIETLDRHQADYELITVNNGSIDRTGALLARCAQTHSRIRVVTVAQNQGYGWGILCGLARSSGDYVGYVDGDTQIPPDTVVAIYTRLRQGQADICKGARVTRHDGLKRKIISIVYNGFFKMLFPGPVRDINAKPKIMTRACYEQLALQSKDWFIDAEIILRARALGLRVEEVAIEFLSRDQGRSKVRIRTMLEFFKNLLVYRLTGPSNKFFK